jgi:hypothetical protein
MLGRRFAEASSRVLLDVEVPASMRMPSGDLRWEEAERLEKLIEGTAMEGREDLEMAAFRG